MKKKKHIDYLFRQIKYVDHRINLLLDYVVLKKDTAKSIAGIVFFLTGAAGDIAGFSAEEKEPLLELKRLMKNWDILEDGDIVGYIYQSLQSKSSLKHKGQFFTPFDIVRYMSASALSFLEKKNGIRVLDPACGSGEFLVALYIMLLKRSRADAPARKKIIRESIFGIDIDPVAVHIARYNLAAVSGCAAEDIQIRCADFLHKDNPQELFDEKTFDIIIGNPPWGGFLSAVEKKYIRKNYESPSSGINTFSLFIERGYDFLRAGGIIGYLIPEAYLNIKAHMRSRKMMIERTSIIRFALWGERFRKVFAPSVSFFASLKTGGRSNVIQVTQGISDNLALMVPQAAFFKTPENIFNINYTKKCVNLITSIEEQKSLRLKDNGRFYLGIVTGDNSRFISCVQGNDYQDPIVTSKDLEPFHVGFSGHYFNYDPDKLQQSAPKEIYLTPGKILYKFIGRQLTFAIDYSGLYSLNNVNGFIPDRDFLSAINAESLAAVLNSRVMQYYYEKNFFTLKVLRGNLERLPIKQISKESQRKLKSLSLLMRESGPESEGFARCRENIEDIIYSEYRISDREVNRMNYL
ncbi:MAG: N-6 DNA methylase [Spirochaetia bacterium]|jgi:predicted RNA methylase|nr:N-6 DNA methylase [Spirochaetia bacterium]